MVSIAGINIETPLALAPMAGVTDVAFRTICREQGAGLTCTEMVSSKALCFQDKKSIPLLKLGDGEHPAAAQIFGATRCACRRRPPSLTRCPGPTSSTSTWLSRAQGGQLRGRLRPDAKSQTWR